MTQTYFLGANSKDGFVSLYEEFPPAPEDYLHIIKGGPGTGKSTFMRKIAQAALDHGLDVHYVLCSGDPDSLDGVYLPQRHVAWVDGTAPHVREPHCFAGDSDYVNIGIFCRGPLSDPDAQRVKELTASYQALYQEAYSFLRAAAALVWEVPVPPLAETGIRSQIDVLLRPEDGAASITGRQSRRFLRALSCQGDCRLSGEISNLCKFIYRVDTPALLYALDRWTGDCILCPSPLDPQQPEALLIPERSLAFVASDWCLPGARALASVGPLPADLAELRQLRQRLLELSFQRLRSAKLLHDQLEAVYRPYVDFDALAAFTEAQIAALFS